MFFPKISSRTIVLSSNIYLKELLIYLVSKSNSKLVILGDEGVCEHAKKFSHITTTLHIDGREIENIKRSKIGEFMFYVNFDTSFLSTLTPDVALEPTPSIEEWKKQTLNIKKGVEVNQQKLMELLIKRGYERTDFLMEKGEMARKGSVLEIFPLHTHLPVRIDFDMDIPYKLYHYNPITGLPEKEIDEVYIPPIKIEGNIPFIDIIPDEALIIVYDFVEFLGTENAERIISSLNKKTKLLVFTPPGTEKLIEETQIEGECVYVRCDLFDPDEFMKKRRRRLYLLSFWIKERLNEGYDVLITHTTKSGRKTLESFLKEYKLDRIQSLSKVWIEEFFFEKGLIIPELRLTLFPFERKIKAESETQEIEPAEEDFSSGDYVVHEEHGIGIYRGVLKKEVNGREEPMLAIEYRNGEYLYLPFTQSHRLKKYRTVDKEVPVRLKLDKLGGESWKKKKDKAIKKIDELSAKLLEKYSKRFTIKREPYEVNEEWLHRLSETFEYEETPDQKKTFQEIITDMRRDYPMERLVCGDVGYGKTEIAVRTACISAMNGRQVAVLVPTTVLVEQHYRIFTHRLAEFPIRIEKLTRFTLASRKNDILEEVEKGKIDILIGTHSLLNERLRFRNLGLLIVDEEHRFGVRHKDIRGYFPEFVDIIYMTATPIPRTLQLTLSGLRDISKIETPPTGRLPVKTFIVYYSSEVIKSICEFEMNRKGQIFFVHNIIEELGEVKTIIENLVPSARIAVLHGKMGGSRIEKTMLNYLNHQIDILISTTIIGFGIDIPGANTIVINNAHNFGLSDLYHLRGRVGRRDEQGFAYLLIPRDKILTHSAIRRLKTFASILSGGRGYHLAKKDLEIRGGGNLLGKEQWGHIYELGFDYYLKLLEERTKQILSVKVKETQLEIKISADEIIPPSFIPETGLRMRYFFRLLNSRSPEEVENIRREMERLWGRIPEITEKFLRIVAVKTTGREKGIQRLILLPTKVIAEYENGNRSVFSIN